MMDAMSMSQLEDWQAFYEIEAGGSKKASAGVPVREKEDARPRRLRTPDEVDTAMRIWAANPNWNKALKA